MKSRKFKLSNQLIVIVCFAFILLFTSLGFILPKVIIPVAEDNLYNYLREPLKLIDSDVNSKPRNMKIAYLYIVNGNILVSDNLKDVIDASNLEDLVSKCHDEYGKFIYNHKNYYYATIRNGKYEKIAISNDHYINDTKKKILGAIFPIVFVTFIIICLVLVLWSSTVVWKIEKLKEKIDNIDNLDYNHSIDFEIDDEIRSLSLAIEDMRISLLQQDKYRNKMYQNISHDFKTPLTVIKSYIEAVDDNVENEHDALEVIKQQALKLEEKVRSLLYLNKLDYLKDAKVNDIVLVDMENIINTEIEKFKYYRKDIQFVVEVDKKSKFYGTVEYWETILDNLLGNFMRYADKLIKISVKQNKLILYNDGDNIDSDLLEGIFVPFRKGIKGEFGLGLSIVKKTLNIIGYDISIRNEKRGVSFIIVKENHK